MRIGTPPDEAWLVPKNPMKLPCYLLLIDINLCFCHDWMRHKTSVSLVCTLVGNQDFATSPGYGAGHMAQDGVL